MRCPICDTEVSNTVTSCPVCGRIMAVESPAESTDTSASTNASASIDTSAIVASTNTSTSADSTVFSIDGAFEPIPAEILHSDILKSVMKFNEQPKVEEEAAAPEPKVQAEAPKLKAETPKLKVKSAPEQKQPVINSAAPEQKQPAAESAAPEQKKKTPIMTKLGQFVKLRRA